jgi:chemotaxis protein methyltransferase CheR
MGLQGSRPPERGGAPAASAGSQAPGEAEAFAGLRDLVLEAGGIDLGLYKDSCVLRRITLRIHSCGARDLRDYLRLVGKDPLERARLVKALTIQVSQFFRNPNTFRAIQDEVLPVILGDKARAGGRALRLWSVGCAHGEEPYSLAILLLEQGQGVATQYATAIYATDIDPPSLRRAKEGRYQTASLTNVPNRWRERYFRQHGNLAEVAPEVRRLVFFKRHSILDPSPFGRIDLAVFRNVLIYMTEALQERVLLALFETLNPGGFLVLGKVEGLTGVSRERFQTVNLSERVYRKPTGP